MPHFRTPDKVHIFISIMSISSSNPGFDHLLLESSHRDDSNEWSNLGFGEEIAQEVLIKVKFMYLTWSSDICNPFISNNLDIEEAFCILFALH